MSRLLVSVRDATEAQAAMYGGADIIDAKEPDYGPMGRCSDAVIESISTVIGGRVPLSVALGELGNDCRLLSNRATFAKIGLRGWRGHANWMDHFNALRAQLRPPSHAIIVAYADASNPRVAAPDVTEVVNLACRNNIHGLLIDTAIKDCGTLCDWIDPRDIQAIVDRCREANVLIALAGSLNVSAIEYLFPTRPDIFAVRGAACKDGRQSRVSGAKVREIAALIQGYEPALPTLNQKQ